MQARTMLLTMVIGGPLAGTLMGIAANPTMVSPPEPAWRSARPDPIYAEPQRIVERGPQDLSPAWYVDRTPTWKRRAAERQAAAYAPLDTSDYEAEPAQARAEPAALTEAAADEAPDRDAGSPVGGVPEARPALVEAAPPPAL